MSWSISKTLAYEHSAGGIEKVLGELRNGDRTQIGNAHCIPERDEQIETAIRAVNKLLRAGGFDNAAELSVALAGHANPEHKKDDSWANEFINVSVSIKSYRTPAES